MYPQTKIKALQKEEEKIWEELAGVLDKYHTKLVNRLIDVNLDLERLSDQ